jgi:hypothetical protein
VKCAISKCNDGLLLSSIFGVSGVGDVCASCHGKIEKVRHELGPAIMELHARALMAQPGSKTPELWAAEKRVNELRELEGWLSL